jgi:aminopeptidase-like protein
MMPTTGRDAYQPGNEGAAAYRLISELYPVCRSLTGNGVRQTLRTLQEQYIPLVIHEVPTGTRVFDWTVPKEWNIRSASVDNRRGERVIDFARSNLHVLGYSVPIRQRMRLEQLKPHLFTTPDYPDWIPYRTSYYTENWGFCLSHNQMLSLEEGEYDVVIDSSLEEGSLTYGEFLVPGQTDDEVLISTHICHPSLCNDNLSGIAVATLLARHLSRLSPRYSYRFVFVPGTIGPITWLSRNEANTSRIKHGLVVVCVGDPGRFTYKKSRRGNAEVDRAVIRALGDAGVAHEVIEFSPYGYDERQYCSPGFNLPVGVLSRTPHGRFPQYHTSADDLAFVRPESLGESFAMYLRVFDILESNRKYLNTNPKGEPQLGRRGLYGAIGGQQDRSARETAMLWVLNMADGDHSLLDICQRSGLTFEAIKDAARLLERHALLVECRR